MTRIPLRGSVALIPVMIVSALLTASLFALSTHSFFTRSSELAHEQSVRASIAGYSCVYSAFGTFVQDGPFLTQGMSLPTGSDAMCVLDAMSITTDVLTVTVHAHYGDSYTSLTATARIRADGGLSVLSVTMNP